MHHQRDHLPWLDQAACQDHWPELWFASGKGEAAAAATRQAIAICHSCPVLTECGEHTATLESWVIGIWAGQTHQQRAEKFHYFLER